MSELAHSEGKFVPLREAKVSVEDRGFVFADGVYEVIVAYDGRPFQLAQHMARLRRSAEAIRLALPKGTSEIQEIIEEGIRRSGFQYTMIYVQITRGVAPRSHPFPTDAKSNLVATFREKEKPPLETREQGVSVITTEDIRWAHCYIKSIALLPNVLANQKAVEGGAFEAIFVTSEGVVHEGSASNIFLVKDERVFTPVKNEKILRGVTREVVLRCAQDAGYETSEGTVRIEELLQADEVFLTGTTIEVLGVFKVDEKTIGTGVVGAVTKRIHERFQQLINRDR